MAEKFSGDKGHEQKERGCDVEMVLKFMRHGERTKDGELTDYGREITAQRAAESGLKGDAFDAVKAIGSTAGPKGPDGMQRSLETADIYAEQIAGDKAFNTRGSEVLNYETLVCPPPLDHFTVYNSFLPENFNELSNEEKARAAKVAQAGVMEQYVGMHTPEAEDFKNEIAGSFAYLVDRYIKMTQRFDSGSHVLMPAGSHGGTMEFLLQKGLVWTDEDGKQHMGFESLSEIGGGFDPSEAYNVVIKTDAEGKLEQIKVSFDNPNRPKGEMWLDLAKLEEPLAFYRKHHPEIEPYPEFKSNERI